MLSLLADGFCSCSAFKSNLKIGEEDIWERSMWIDLAKQLEAVKIIMSCIKSSREEELNNQVDRLNHFVGSQPFHSIIYAIFQLAHEQSGQGGRDGG